MWFDRKKTERGREALKQYRAEYDDDKRTFKDKPLHDWTSHPADGMRTLAMGWRAIAPPQPDKEKGRTLGNGLTLNDMWKAQRPKERRI
jgi:hypothetical protein